MNYNGTNGTDNITGTNNPDLFHMQQGGNDKASGLGGADIFDFGAAWSAGDRVDGGSGSDTLQLSQGGNDLLIGSRGLTSVEVVDLADNGDYTITFQGAGGIGDSVVVDGTGLGSNHFMTVDAGNEKTRSVTLLGGDDSDHLTGGHVSDTLTGGAGLDFIDGEGGGDFIGYNSASDSTGINADHVTLSVQDDAFFFSNSISGVDDVVKGKLYGTSASKFDDHLADKIGSGELSANHAVVFQVKIGDWAGHYFLIVDGNGSAGYQAGQDWVIDLLGNHLTDISASNFVA